jgi:TPR repeat protein
MKTTEGVAVNMFCAAIVSGCLASPSGVRKESVDPAAKAGGTTAGLAMLAGQPDWLYPIAECPVDAFPTTQVRLAFPREACISNLLTCVQRCQEGEPSACYAAAQRTEDLKAEPEAAQALFLRACRLGIASGCTNRAAGLVFQKLDRADVWSCANRTFKAMCDRADPWACTMWGSSLARGRGTRQDLDQALRVLPKGCALGETDEACIYARRTIREIEALRGDSRGAKP